jgi:hypothetical protein
MTVPNIRFAKLLKLIRESRRTVHDLSRIELGANALPRFNMPFEVGLAMGAKHFGKPDQRQKTALVMVRANHALPAYLSDMGGSDQQAHNNDPSEVMRIVSRYLHQTPAGGPVPGRTWLVNSLALFKREVLPAMATAAKRGLDETDPFDDYRVYLSFVNAYLVEAKKAGG